MAVKNKMTGSAAGISVGLALGGGGAKGLAHIGVLRALGRAGIRISHIAGTSMGALVGGWYAAMGETETLEELFASLKKRDVNSLASILYHRDGRIFHKSSIADALAEKLGERNIEECSIPFQAIATDARTGEEVRIERGRLVDAIRASAALPLIFQPVEIDGRLLMDGGCINPVPADAARSMGAEYVVAVKVSGQWLDASRSPRRGASLYQMVSHILGAVEHQLALRSLKNADFVIEPDVEDLDWLEFDRGGAIIEAGLREAYRRLPELQEELGLPPLPKTAIEMFLDFLRYA